MIQRILLRRCIKTLLSLLLFAFIASGLGTFLQKQREDYAIKIGNIEYSLSALNKVLQDSAQKFKTRRNINPSNNRLSQLQSNRLNDIIHNTLVLVEARKLGIVLDDNLIKKIILNTSIFHKNGIFSKHIFKQILKDNNQSQQDFIKKLKDSIIKSIFIDSLSFYHFNTPGLTKIVLQELFQKRYIELIEIPFSSFEKLIKPKNLQLNLIYKKYKSQFLVPDQRDIEYITLSLDSLTREDDIVVKDEEIKKIFDASNTLFNEPEQRDIKQIRFRSLNDARYARNQLMDGVSFQMIAKRYNHSLKGYDMGLVTPTDFNDHISSILFRLKSGTVSEIIQTPSGFYIFKVVNIFPQGKKSFEDVKKSLKNEYLQNIKFNNFVAKLKTIQKEIQQGNSLKSVSQKYSQRLKTVTISYSIRDDRDIIGGKAFVDNSFYLNLNTQSPLFAIDANNFCILTVTGINTKKVLAFHQIKPQLQNLWSYDKISSYIHQMDIQDQSMLCAKRNNTIGIRAIYIQLLNNQLNNNITLKLHKEIYDLEISHYTKPTMDLLKQVVVFAKLKNIQLPVKEEIQKYKFLYRNYISKIEQEIIFLDIFRKLKAKSPIVINSNLIINK